MALLGLLAIFSEVIATSSLKSTEGFTNFIPSVVVMIDYCTAFYFLSLTGYWTQFGPVWELWELQLLRLFFTTNVLTLVQ